MPTADRLAYDRASVRHIDQDGRLHVELTPISKANVCGYLGAEIPNFEALGLDPRRTYQLYRDPGELRKAVATFNNLPVLSKHVAVTASDHRPDLVIGSTGTDAKFDAPYLRCSLVIWSDKWIDRIENGTQRELSSAYRYKAVMTPGTQDGVAYDGIMTEIDGSHVALVEEGRAGPDVLVQDEMPAPPYFNGDYTMKTSRKALLARGALATYLRPKLAQDAKIDLKAALMGTTAMNWPTAKPAIIARVKAATAGKLATDASLEDMHSLLDSLDREGEDEMDDIEGMDEEESEEDKAKREAKEKADKAATDEEAETEEEKAARMKKRADDKAAKDAEMPEALKAAAEKAAKDAEPKPITKSAMDAAIAAAVTATQVTQQQIREAERDVFPWIGAVLPQTTPEAVYRLALDSMPRKPNLTGVPASAFKAILAAYGDPGRQRNAPIAMDAAGASDFDKRFPDVSRILAA